MPDKYIKVISAMYENSIAAVKVRNEIKTWSCVMKLSRVTSYPHYMNHPMDFVLKKPAKTKGEHGIKRESKTFLDLDYAAICVS